MKKTNLATAIKSVCVLSTMILCTHAFAEPKVSGRLYLSTLYDNVENKETNLTTNVVTSSKADRTTLNSGGSRIRVTGSEKLTDDTSIQYRLEYSVYLDNDGAGKNFTSRNTYVGLENKTYGTVLVGRIFTPDDDIDYVDQSYLYASGTGAPFNYFGQRTNNTIQYISPKFNHGKTQIKLHYAMDEDKTSVESSVNNHGGSQTVFVGGVPTTVKKDLISGHILHEDTKFDAGMAYTYMGDFNALRAMVSVKPNDKLTVGVMAQQVDYNSGNKELGALLSGYYKINGNTDVYAQAGHTKNFAGYKDGKKTVASTGVVKWLKNDGGVRLRAFGSLSYADSTTFKAGNSGLTKVESDAVGIETGLRYDF